MADIGFVYIMGNRAMPGIYKIGMTLFAPSRRAAELSNGSAVPMPFEVMAYGEIPEPADFEQVMHGWYHAQRVSPNREFFQVPVETLIASLVENCSSVAVAYDRNDEFWRGL